MQTTAAKVIMFLLERVKNRVYGKRNKGNVRFAFLRFQSFKEKTDFVAF